MKKLSESLEALSARADKLEASATATFEADRATLEQRRTEIDAALAAEGDEFDTAIRQAADAGRSWWNDTTAALGKPMRELRARHEERQSEHQLHRAMRIADAAEEDAAAAMEIATYWLNIAEYAVVDGALARMAADDLAVAAEQSADEKEPVHAAGGVS